MEANLVCNFSALLGTTDCVYVQRKESCHFEHTTQQQLQFTLRCSLISATHRNKKVALIVRLKLILSQKYSA